MQQGMMQADGEDNIDNAQKRGNSNGVCHNLDLQRPSKAQVLKALVSNTVTFRVGAFGEVVR